MYDAGLALRALAKFTVGDDCWEWAASKGSNGYGLIRSGSTRRCAHRVVYEMLVGPIPNGLELDHLCKNRGCVRPDHLESVTRAENIRRSDQNTVEWQAAGMVAAAAARRCRTHCLRGHEFTPENTRTRGTSRICRACNSQAQRERRA